MARAITHRNRETVLLEADKDLPFDEQTAFIMGPVMKPTQDKALDIINTLGQSSQVWVTLLLKECLKGVEDDRPLRDEDGNEVPFEKDRHGAPLDRWLGRISPLDRIELAANRLSTFLPSDDEPGEVNDLEKSEPALPGQ